MKKRMVFIICAVVLVLALLITGVVFLARDSRLLQMEAHEQYATMRDNAQALVFVITEDGQQTGTYTLEQLGMLEDTLAAVDGAFDEEVRMKPDDFAKLPVWDVLSWRFGRAQIPQSVAVSMAHADVYPVMEDLIRIPREDAVDACAAYEDGSFVVVEEVPGTRLDTAAVQQALEQTISGVNLTAANPVSVGFELTEHSCYLLPEKTVENTVFDFEEELENAIKDLSVTVQLQDKQEVLESDQLADVLSVTQQGKVEVDEKALEEIVAGWHETYRYDGVPYLFTAQVGGVKPIDFLTVDYELDQQATKELLIETLLSLQPAQMDAQWYCWRKGEAFTIEENYVEVDIPNQKMTYVKDGEVLVCTDVVTGASWGFPTPPGLYKVENKDTDCWLEGPDYRVFVDYWIGFVGYEYGIHDADWRTKFGGENYIKNGSHGCVNTPKEATATIFDNIEVGVPVLVYGK